MTMPPARVYVYDRCETCRKALRFLEAKGVAYTSLPIRSQPPALAELQQMLVNTGDLRRLFNTSGQDYRDMQMVERLPLLTTDEALTLLASRGNLVKRPFLLLPDGRGTTGFHETVWNSLFEQDLSPDMD